MFHAFSRSFLLVGLSGSLLLACSSDATPENGGPGGTSSGGSTAGNATGGSSTAQAGTATSGGTTSGGTTSGSSAGTSAGAGTASGGGATGGAAGTTGGGSGGAAGGSSGGGGGAAGGGGAGGGGAKPTAVAMITGVNGKVVTGTATFTQEATMTKLALKLTACPDGPHSSHLHLVKDCGDNGTAAGGHWTPNGEMLGDYSCANNMVTYEVSKPVSTWTVGDGSATDVTKYSFMVHETSDAMSSGQRIGCGLINKQ